MTWFQVPKILHYISNYYYYLKINNFNIIFSSILKSFLISNHIILTLFQNLLQTNAKKNIYIASIVLLLNSCQTLIILSNNNLE